MSTFDRNPIERPKKKYSSSDVLFNWRIAGHRGKYFGRYYEYSNDNDESVKACVSKRANRFVLQSMLNDSEESVISNIANRGYPDQVEYLLGAHDIDHVIPSVLRNSGRKKTLEILEKFDFDPSVCVYSLLRGWKDVDDLIWEHTKNKWEDDQSFQQRLFGGRSKKTQQFRSYKNIMYRLLERDCSRYFDYDIKALTDTERSVLSIHKKLGEKCLVHFDDDVISVIFKFGRKIWSCRAYDSVVSLSSHGRDKSCIVDMVKVNDDTMKSKRGSLKSLTIDEVWGIKDLIPNFDRWFCVINDKCLAYMLERNVDNDMVKRNFNIMTDKLKRVVFDKHPGICDELYSKVRDLYYLEKLFDHQDSFVRKNVRDTLDAMGYVFDFPKLK